MDSKNLVQVEVLWKRLESVYIPPSRKGDTHWLPLKPARHLIEIGACRLAPAPAKVERPPVAPVEAPRLPLRASDDAPVDRFAVIDRGWEGKTVVCIASGPSVTPEQLEIVRAARERDEIRVAVVNDMYLVAPWADLLYFADAKWWQWHSQGLPKAWPWVKFTAEQVAKAYASFAGQKATIFGTGMATSDPKVFMLHNHGSDKLSEKRNGLHTGSNSGYQVLNLVTLAGAKRIPLVGYDMRFTNGKSHSHNGHPHKMPENSYRDFAKTFATMVPQLQKWGVEVLNCTPGSAIQCFPRADLASLLASPA